MMEDLAMHLLEILMNSVKAGAGTLTLKIYDSWLDNVIRMTIIDDGCGMDEEMAKKAADPFTTSRTTRKIGMGLAFMKGLTETCNGSFSLDSEVGKGTTITAEVEKECIDTPPLGDLGEISMETIQANPDIDYTLEYTTDSNHFIFTSMEVRKELDGVSLMEPEILLWIKEYINQGIEQAKEDTL
ncbi:MAG: ATP-binding protein [Solobacterium sp.]|nr:ATP-binding protein [Solobacterium sp.]